MRRGADDYRPPETFRTAPREGPRERDTERPGVPMEDEPDPVEGAREGALPVQRGWEQRPTRAGLEESTPVFGSAQPLHGTSGRIRRHAYRIPEHRARHWMLLMAADRVDVIEDRVGSVLGGAFRALGREDLARTAGRDPLPMVAGVVAGAVLARWLWPGR